MPSEIIIDPEKDEKTEFNVVKTITKVTMSKEKSDICKNNIVCDYDRTKSELSFVKNTSTKEKCWRLVHDGASVLLFFESDGVTETGHDMYLGTYEECLAEIDKLGLKWNGQTN